MGRDIIGCTVTSRMSDEASGADGSQCNVLCAVPRMLMKQHYQGKTCRERAVLPITRVVFRWCMGKTELGIGVLRR